MRRIIVGFILLTGTVSAAEIAAGWAHSVAVRDGRVWTWGDNADGQLGQPDARRVPQPRPVNGLDKVVAVSASRHTLALTSDGMVFAWGRNSSGQLGNGRFGLDKKELRPVQVADISDIVAISAGWEHSLALDRHGKVYAWGSRSHGQLGDGVCRTGMPAAKPLAVPGLRNITAIAAGGQHNLALHKDGYVYAWGDNGFGQLGRGDFADGLTARKVAVFSESSRVLPPGPQTEPEMDYDPPAGKVLNVRDYGAAGDGIAFDQAALQKSIDECAKQGGGIVWLPPGVYRTGTLELRNGVRLHLNAGAVILASTNCEHYPERRFISAENVDNISITGEGVIDALGYFTGARGWRHYCIFMKNCQNVLLDGVATVNAGSWTQHYIRCAGLTIRGVTVRSLRPGRNNDGIDISGCENVLIEGCTIISDDDAIVIKSQKAERKNRNIKAISNVCHTYRGAFKLGTETRGRYENISCRDMTCYGSKALELYSVDGSEISNITARNIRACDALMALGVRVGARLRSSYWEKGLEPEPGYLRNIKIRNLDVEIGNKSWREILLEHNIPDAEWANSKPEHPYDSFISGLPGYPVENVLIDGIKLRLPGGNSQLRDPAKIPENPKAYPHGGNFGTLPAHGLFIRHAKDVVIRNTEFSTEKPDVRPAVVFFDVEGQLFREETLP
ncbi:MAG: glycosyl hydrolase family 28 protein [Kiritimatiellia bacterium]